jgi:hypothetical protein
MYIVLLLHLFKNSPAPSQSIRSRISKSERTEDNAKEP